MRALEYPAGALLVIGGPPGAGKSTLAARALPEPALDPDAVRAAAGDGSWPAALARFHAELDARLAGPGAVAAVSTALRHGHRLGLARRAAAHGRALHLLLVDAPPAACRAARASRPAARIPDGLFEHLLREWAAYRRALARDPGSARAPAASIVVADRAAAAALERIILPPPPA